MAHPDAGVHRAYFMCVCLCIGADPNGDITPNIDNYARNGDSLDAKERRFKDELAANLQARRARPA